MNKESIKSSIKSFGDNFFFNISANLIFSVFMNIDLESIILTVGVIINIVISQAMSLGSNNTFIQRYFCKPTTESQINAAGSCQLFGFITGYFTINRYIKLNNMTWISSLVFLIAISILFGKLYIENSFSITQIISFWFLGFFIGAIVGLISGRAAKNQRNKEINDTCKDSTPNSEDETTCGENQNQDYVCQAFKDGKVFQSL